MKARFNLRIILLICLSLFAIMQVTPSFAMTLNQAKAQGLVGEQVNGYVGIVSANAPPQVKAMVNKVNVRRRQAYLQIARKNRTSLNAVEAIAGKTAIGKTPRGYFIKTPRGWARKP